MGHTKNRTRLLTLLLLLVAGLSAAADLTGHWNGNDGGTYYVRQLGGELWWYGASGDDGRTWSNVLHGSLRDNHVYARWADVPQGQIQSGGEIELQVLSPDHLVATRRTGGFGGSEWTRIGAVSAAGLPAGVPHYLGCFHDQGDPFGTSGRDLNGVMEGDQKNMSTERCVAICAGKGFPYAGTQYSSQCFCGASYGKFGPGEGCNMHCAGNPGQICGGTWFNSVYSTGGASTPGGRDYTSSGAMPVPAGRDYTAAPSSNAGKPALSPGEQIRNLFNSIMGK